MQIKFLSQDIRISFNSDLLPISHYIVRCTIFLSLSDDIDRSSTRTDILICGGASVGLIMGVYSITHVANQITVGHFIVEHDGISESEQAILGISLRNLKKKLLSMIVKVLVGET